MSSLTGILVPIGTTYLLFWGIVAIMRVAKESSIKARMVELGHLEPEKQWILQKSANTPDAYSNLKFGILLISVGSGLIAVRNLDLEYDSPTILGLLALLAGAGFLVYFLIMKYLYKKAD